MNRVRVSCVSRAPMAADPGAAPAATLDRVIRHWQDRLATVLPDQPDLIVLPEMCDHPTGLDVSGQLEFLAFRGDAVADALATEARRHRCSIAYAALRIAADGTVRNSIQMLGRDGALVGVYDKNYPTGGERDLYGVAAGTEPAVFDLDFGRVGAVICFDLNFDELRLRYAAERPDLIVFCSVYHGGLMQQYWAYSCRAWLAACVHPPAPSGITSPVGELTGRSTNYHEEVTATINLDRALVHLDGNREKLAEAKRRHGPDIAINDPGLLGSVLVTSETDAFSVDELVAEFGLEVLDDYFARCRRERSEALL